MSRACMEELVRIQHLINIVARVPMVCRAFVAKSLSIRAPHNRAKMAARVPWRYHFDSKFIFDYSFIVYSAINTSAPPSPPHYNFFNFTFVFFRAAFVRATLQNWKSCQCTVLPHSRWWREGVSRRLLVHIFIFAGRFNLHMKFFVD